MQYSPNLYCRHSPSRCYTNTHVLVLPSPLPLGSDVCIYAIAGVLTCNLFLAKMMSVITPTSARKAKPSINRGFVCGGTRVRTADPSDYIGVLCTSISIYFRDFLAFMPLSRFMASCLELNVSVYTAFQSVAVLVNPFFLDELCFRILSSNKSPV